jgi:hypothetical protein
MTKRDHRDLRIHLLFVLILIGAFFLRAYGIEWDQGYLFHPDERKILMVADDLSFPWPPDASLFDPQSSWNPRFFAYGSLPIYLLRLLADLAKHIRPDLATLESSYLVGRLLSVVFDLGAICLIFRLGKRIYDPLIGLLAATLTTITVLHIQLAHFYAVDTVLTFFVLWTIERALAVLLKPSTGRGIGLGAVLGLALATKISAAPLALTIALAWLVGSLLDGQSSSWPKRVWRTIRGCGISGLAASVVFLICQPYALIDVVSFIVDVLHEGRMARGLQDIPYTRQFIGTAPYLYPLKQAIIWSMGIPLGVTALLASLFALLDALRRALRRDWRRFGELLLPISWVGLYFGIVGSFHAKFLRYMLPVMPLLCLWVAWSLISLVHASGKWERVRRAIGAVGLVVVLLSTSFYALAYMNVYRQTHPWIQATEWLCRNLPPSRRIMVEHWDDPLPLIQGTGELGCYYGQRITQFPAYDRDDAEKLETLLTGLLASDYIVLSSNRLYNTIPRLPARYPLTSRYYQLLMEERLGFELVYYAAVYPRIFGVDLVDDTFTDPALPRPKLLADEHASRRQINLGRADESYSVYDHPMPLVFKKTVELSRDELLALLGKAAQDLAQPTE